MIWNYQSMAERLNKHLAEYRVLSQRDDEQARKYRKIKRRAILIWLGWMRKVKAGGKP